jgi:hypothetical protein
MPLRHLPYLLALHCCFSSHCNHVKLKLAVVALRVVVYATAAAMSTPRLTPHHHHHPS